MLVDVGYRANGERSGSLPSILLAGEGGRRDREEHSSMKWVGIKLKAIIRH